MKKSLFVLSLMLVALVGRSYAYDFHSVAPTGQTLYYNIVDGYAVVTYPGDSTNCWDPDLYTEPADTLIVPSIVTYNDTDYVVRAVGRKAFSNCARLLWVKLGDSIVRIEASAFQYCTRLERVDVSGGLESIGAQAFEYCSSMRKFVIPQNVHELGVGAFSFCSMLDSIMLPSAISTINESLFYSCGSLATIFVPNTITSIGFSAFRSCSSLRTITLPNSITSIGGAAFAYCSNLRSFVFPDSVTTVNNYTFFDCGQLTSVTLPEGLQSIQGSPFNRNVRMTELISLNPVPPTVSSNLAATLPSDVLVRVPCGSYDVYASDSVWGAFSNLMEYPGYHIDYSANDTAAGDVVLLVEPTCTSSLAQVQAVPHEGYEFDHWHDGNRDNPRSVDVTVDPVLIAYFVYVGPIGINTIDEVEARVTTASNSIVVSGAEGLPIRVYEINGRLCHSCGEASVNHRFAVEHPGVYLVQIGQYRAIKVVVLPQ